MSFEDIKIYRDAPVVNGYAQVPPCSEADKTAYGTGLWQALADAGLVEIVRLTGGSGPQTGSSFGAQEMIRIPWIDPASDCCSTMTGYMSMLVDYIAARNA